jgi:mannose-6-phosphate isomerase-like protein (cupin superfamily)
MNTSPLTVINLKEHTPEVNTYKNIAVTLTNDHIIRLSVMTAPFYWHYHPNSDETFLVTEGVVCIDLEDRTVELAAGQLFTIPANVKHCTRPLGARSVNLTFELNDMETIKV